MEKVEIRGLEVLAAKNEAVLVDFLMNGQSVKTGELFALNAEKLVMCEKQPEIHRLLQQAEYNYADGISIVRAIKKKYPQFGDIERIAGADLWQALMKQAGQLNIPVFLIGGDAQTVAKVHEKLIACDVNIVGVQDGYFQAQEEQALIKRIAESKAKFVTVGMGSPKQESFIRKAREYYSEALYMGVGGTYDVFIGKVKRAPKIWQNLGLEWLYRLLKQPTRWRRQLNLLLFAYYYFTNRL